MPKSSRSAASESRTSNARKRLYLASCPRPPPERSKSSSYVISDLSAEGEQVGSLRRRRRSGVQTGPLTCGGFRAPRRQGEMPTATRAVPGDLKDRGIRLREAVVRLRESD